MKYNENDEYVTDWINSQPIISGNGKILNKQFTNKNPLYEGSQSQRLNQSYVEAPHYLVNQCGPDQSTKSQDSQQPGLRKTKSCKNFYELEDTHSFAEQVDNTDMHKDFKDAFVGVHGKMLGMKNEYQVECENLTKERNILQRDLRTRNTQLEWAKTQLKTKKDELDSVTCELQRTKQNDRATLDNAAETESKLAESESKLMAIEVENEEFRRENRELTEIVTNLTVDKLQAESRLGNLESTIKTLRGTIKYREEGLAEKIIKYDELFERCEKANSQLVKLAENSCSMYETLSQNQAVHLKQFREVCQYVEKLKNQLEQIEAKLEDLQENEMSSIESTLKEVRKIIKEDLGKEIEATTQKRQELSENHSSMNGAFKSLQTDFKSHYVRICKEVKKITSVSKDDSSELVFYIILAAAVFSAFGFLLCYFLYFSSKKY